MATEELAELRMDGALWRPSSMPNDPIQVSLVIGREAACDVVLDHPTVSSRHARLVFTASGLVLEDLGSTNGTFVGVERITRVRIERGSEVRLGDVLLPWSHPAIVAWARRVAGRGTLLMSGVRAASGSSPRTARAAARMLGAFAAVGCVFAAIGAWRMDSHLRSIVVRATDGGGITVEESDGIAEEIRRTRAPAIAAAIDFAAPVTRNTAVKLAAHDQGPFHIEQVARIWTHVRGHWRYVNDPQGTEYFAKASETIANDYAGDCDDFATVLAAMITAIGGEMRVVLMNSEAGGHAYAEACIRTPPDELASRLGQYYRRKWDPYLGRQRLDRIHFRVGETCPLWLNLDWSAGVPGGPYGNETWAVAVTPRGETEELVAGRADTDAGIPLRGREEDD